MKLVRSAVNHICAIGVICGYSLVPSAYSADYRILPSATSALPGSFVSFSVEAQTQPGDNVVGQGYFSFAIDVTLLGTAGAVGTDIMNVSINEVQFDDVVNNFHGHAAGAQYIDVSGVTTDAFPPTFGQNPGDVVSLFTFDLRVPPAAPMGSTITVIPAEGFLENLVANSNFDNVVPQAYRHATLTVVPEPGVTAILLVGFIYYVAGRRTLSALPVRSQ